ncbi:MAG: hypothetical protein VR73_10915 [Gammaproteobacteria bacterium BRH_c0]|nr:MAG: hypothetical protein VR73_10915 [Gammaproteobacteria bacterium BRH_c0]
MLVILPLTFNGILQSIAEPAAIVSTTSGLLKGHSSKGVMSFLGIPYGADTGGQNRFLPPKPPEPWENVRNAEKYGPQCSHQKPPMYGDITKILIYSDLPTSEDCLSLNVWTPDVNTEEKRPVMVYLHGGGFFMGSSSDRYYEGGNLARENDIVVVTLNHRLSVFGYFYLGPDAGPEYSSSGAVGMLDIVQALTWVRDNIAQFGGDPGNVTIFGQSGGGMKVSTVMAMPSANGLFHKAIIQSGPGRWLNTPKEASKLTADILRKLNLTAADTKQLAAIPADKLLDAASGGMRLIPVMGNNAIPVHPFADSAPEQSARIPLLIGAMKDESTNSLLSDPEWRSMDEGTLKQRVAALVGKQDAQKVIDMYQSSAPNDPPQFIWASILSDSGFFNETYPLADLKSEQPSSVYMYRVDWRSPVLGGIIRAAHAVDLPFVWDNVDVSEALVGKGPDQERMAQMMSRSFAEFARSGDPNVPGVIPKWPEYNKIDQATLIFDNQVRVENNPDQEKRAYWQAFKASSD